MSNRRVLCKQQQKEKLVGIDVIWFWSRLDLEALITSLLQNSRRIEGEDIVKKSDTSTGARWRLPEGLRAFIEGCQRPTAYRYRTNRDSNQELISTGFRLILRRWRVRTGVQWRLFLSSDMLQSVCLCAYVCISTWCRCTVYTMSAFR